MIIVETAFTVTLGRAEAQDVKTVLGTLTDPEFEDRGITGFRREQLRILWSMLPDGDEEQEK